MPEPAPRPETATRILDAALDVFSEHGYRGTSVRAIATAAGVNVAAMNYHWGSKQRLWVAVCAHCSRRVMDAVQASVRLPLVPAQVLDEVLGAVFDLFAADPRPVRILVWSWMQSDEMDFDAAADTFDPVVNMVFRYVEQLQADGVLPTFDTAVVLALIEGVIIMPFISQVGGRRQHGVDLSDPAHAQRVKREVLRATRLLLGGIE